MSDHAEPKDNHLWSYIVYYIFSTTLLLTACSDEDVRSIRLFAVFLESLLVWYTILLCVLVPHEGAPGLQ